MLLYTTFFHLQITKSMFIGIWSFPSSQRAPAKCHWLSDSSSWLILTVIRISCSGAARLIGRSGSDQQRRRLGVFLWPFPNDAVPPSLREPRPLAALTFNLCCGSAPTRRLPNLLIASIFVSRPKSWAWAPGALAADVPLRRSHLALSLSDVVESGSWTLCLSVFFGKTLLTVPVMIICKGEGKRMFAVSAERENSQQFSQ